MGRSGIMNKLVLAYFLYGAEGMAIQPKPTNTQASQPSPAVASNTEVSGPTFSKKLSTPDAVPVAGQLRAMELMNSGALFRYTPGVLSETSLAEEAMCEYTGFKYAVGFNSCGSAIFIGLKTAGVQPGDKVLANAFSFTAVPSAIHHAGAIPTYVESTDGYVMDMDDLEAKIAANPDAKYLLLTHMRGKVADMNRAYEIAAKHGIVVVEDCAHALGIQWEGKQLGRGGAVAACFSSQSAKMINSGEGGFLMTDDDEVAARAYCYAGCYESLYDQHVVSPPREVFDAVKKETPNYSLRMSDLTACCVRPQIDNLEERIEEYNVRYFDLVEQLKDCPSFHVPPIDERVRPVCDSLQLNLRMTEEEIDAFLAASKRRGLPVGLFGSKDNARNFRNWKYSPIATGVDFTEGMIAAAIDVRLPLSFSREEIAQIGAVLLAAEEDVKGAQEGI